MVRRPAGVTATTTTLPRAYRRAHFTNVLVAGAAHVCALLESDRTAVCWGSTSHCFTCAPAGVAFSRLASGWLQEFGAANANAHTCGVRVDDSTAECWGRGDYGKRNTNDDALLDVGVGGHNTCNVLTDGTAYCYGQSSPDINTHFSIPATPLFKEVHVSRRWDSLCFVTQEDDIICYGSNVGICHPRSRG